VGRQPAHGTPPSLDALPLDQPLPRRMFRPFALDYACFEFGCGADAGFSDEGPFLIVQRGQFAAEQFNSGGRLGPCSLSPRTEAAYCPSGIAPRPRCSSSVLQMLVSPRLLPVGRRPRPRLPHDKQPVPSPADRRVDQTAVEQLEGVPRHREQHLRVLPALGLVDHGGEGQAQVAGVSGPVV